MGRNIWDQKDVKKRDDCFQALSLRTVTFTYLPNPAFTVNSNGTFFQWTADQAYSIRKVFIGSVVETNFPAFVTGGAMAFGWSFGMQDIIIFGPGLSFASQGGAFAQQINGGACSTPVNGAVPQNEFYKINNVYIRAGQTIYFNYGCEANAIASYVTTTLYLLETHI